jgi:hypothetical protein
MGEHVSASADSFHNPQFGKGNNTADWVACGVSKSSSCRPWEAASSPRPNGCVPYEGILSWSPRLVFFLKVNERLFHTWRIASLKELALLVFDRQFDLSNLSSTRLRLFAFHVPALIGIFIPLACAESTLYPDTSGGIATLRKRYCFWQSSGIFTKFGTSPSCVRSSWGLPNAGACAHEQERALFVVCR